MKKFFKFFIIILFIVITIVIYMHYLKPRRDYSSDKNFKTWIDIKKKSFFDNEAINIMLKMKYIGEKEEFDVFKTQLPFSLSISGNNGFYSKIESPNTFGTQKYSFKKGETITMDCSNYGFYDYFEAMNIFKGYEHTESTNKTGSEFVLPPGEYTLTLTTCYEDELSDESKHKLVATENIKVKAKNNRERIHEVKSLKEFNLDVNLDKNIYELDEIIRIWSSMTYCGGEKSFIFPYISYYPLQIYIYDDKHEKLELDYSIYFNLDEGRALTNTKPLYYAPFTRLTLPSGKYTAEFLFYYPNEDGTIITDVIEKDFEVVPKSIS